MKRRAVYPGTFDPITNGHIDLIKRAGTIFDEVIIAVSGSIHKNPLLSLDERIALVKKSTKSMKFAKVHSYEGLLVDYLKRANRRIVIRGLRAVSDFEYEFQLALMNKQLGKSIEMIYMMPQEDFIYISSSAVKEIAHHKGDVSKFVPKHVEALLKRKYSKTK